jgi:hypothetical protein
MQDFSKASWKIAFGTRFQLADDNVLGGRKFSNTFLSLYLPLPHSGVRKALVIRMTFCSAFFTTQPAFYFRGPSPVENEQNGETIP